MTAVTALKTWTTSQHEEDAMFEGHIHLWRTMIQMMEEENLRGRTILDFGCNQGGFLRMLYNLKPFHKAFAVDIAAESVKKAQSLNPGLPITFGAPELLDTLGNSIDTAFSHEVVYLLQDLDAHAKQIRKVLKTGGVYYCATGCHTENPLWPAWHKLISSYSNIPVPHYSLNDYAQAFENNGFMIEFAPFRPQGFMRFHGEDKQYYPSVFDKIQYYTKYKTLFRFTKLEG